MRGIYINPDKYTFIHQSEPMASQRKFSKEAITEDAIEKAFEKTKDKFKIPGFDMVLIKEQHYEKAMKLYKEQFIPREPLCRAVNLQWCEIIEHYMLDVFRKHLSLMFVDEKTGEPVAFRTISLISRDDDDNVEPPIPLPIQDLLQYIKHCDEQANFFDHFGVDDAFRFIALVVSQEYTRRGLATRILHAAVDMIRNLGFEQVVIKGEGSSNYSKRIYEKEGFKTLYEDVYATWEVDGRRPLLNTGEHKTIKIYGRVVTPDHAI